jgi:ferredoxin-NADP reductase
MPETIAPAPPVADRAAHLLFLLFIHVADADGGLAARDVQGLNRMLDRPDWSESPFLRSAQAQLRARYFDLWQDYQKGGVSREMARLASQLTSVLTAPGAPGPAEIKLAAEAFLRRLEHESAPLPARLMGLAAMAPGRRAARAEIDLLLTAACQEGGPIPPAAAVSSPPAPAARAAWPAATLMLSAENRWRRGRMEVRCEAVIPETADVRTFVLVPAKPTLLVYEPGQFVTLELPIEGKTVRRSYTMSSSPSRPHAMSITVKRIPNGQVSNWLHDNLRPGAALNLSGPHGMFSCFNAPSQKLLLVAAGSGITPIMSMLRWLCDTASACDIVFINNVRTPSDIIFARELDYIATRMGDRLRLGVVPAAGLPGAAWNGPIGRFSDQLIRLWAPDFAEREVFVCGPAGYMKVVRATLERMGLPMARYHEESFGAPQFAMVSATAPPLLASPASTVVPAAPRAATATVEVVFVKSGKTVTANEGDFLLDLAEEHDVAIESGCRAGNCGACKVIGTEGKVVMEEQTALSAEDIADGYVLTCVGRAFGRRVILQA